MGSHARKIKKLSGDTGHAAHNNNPPPIAIKKFPERFKLLVLVKIKVC